MLQQCNNGKQMFRLQVVNRANKCLDRRFLSVPGNSPIKHHAF